MRPLPRCLLSVASRFSLEPNWPARLAVGTGVRETDNHFFPCGPWRPPSPDELALLISGPEENAEASCLFQIPGHLRSAWWDLLDRSVEAQDAALPGFEEFSGRIAEFLRFKNMDLPPRLRMEAVVTSAGRCSMRSDPETGTPAGLGPSLAPWAACASLQGSAQPRLWGLVNLGDEETHLVLILVSIQEMAADPACWRPDRPQPTTVGELVGSFLREFRDDPPIRLRLAPGEGFRLPSGGLILDADATDKQEPDVLLLISEQVSASPGIPPVVPQSS
jgi:hypothetical protein